MPSLHLYEGLCGEREVYEKNSMRSSETTFGWFIGDFDCILEDRDREALVWHGGEEETEVTVYDSVRCREPFHHCLHCQHPGGSQMAVLCFSMDNGSERTHLWLSKKG